MTTTQIKKGGLQATKKLDEWVAKYRIVRFVVEAVGFILALKGLILIVGIVADEDAIVEWIGFSSSRQMKEQVQKEIHVVEAKVDVLTITVAVQADSIDKRFDGLSKRIDYTQLGTVVFGASILQDDYSPREIINMREAVAQDALNTDSLIVEKIIQLATPE